MLLLKTRLMLIVNKCSRRFVVIFSYTMQCMFLYVPALTKETLFRFQSLHQYNEQHDAENQKIISKNTNLFQRRDGGIAPISVFRGDARLG